MEKKSSKDEFLSRLSTVKREGIDRLITYLEKSSFFTDPASADGHNSYEGGLVDHSLQVLKLLEAVAPKDSGLEDSIKIVGLLHDVSLAGSFQRSMKNVTVRGPDGKNMHREDGRLLFIEKEVYDYVPEQQLPYPQGQLSVMLLKQYIKLTKLEDLAIFWQNGLREGTSALSHRAMKTHWFIFKTAVCDLEAKLYAGDKNA